MERLRQRLLAAALGAGLLAAPVAAQVTTETARVVAVLDGETLVLDRSLGPTREVRLMGIAVPEPAADGTVAPAEAARRALAAIAEGRTVTLTLAAQPVNRYGQVLAHAALDDGTWLQAVLLERGLARVQTLPQARARAAEMLAIEAQARGQGRGLWADPLYRVRPAEAAVADIGTFQLVEGTVRRVARGKGRVYLNFGDDWRSDFTVSVPSRRLAQLRRDGIDVMALAGRAVRVRGWLDQLNGPMIELTHAEQLELLPATSAGAAIRPAAAAAPSSAQREP